jgi:hypothetical protein
MNSVAIAGTIQKIRPFNAHHVLIHMASGSNRITLALPEEQDITLMVGEKVNVQGWLEDVPYEESFAAFLERAGRSNLIEQYVELTSLRDRTIQRALTVVTPTKTQNLLNIDSSTEENPENVVRLEGLVVRTWAYSRNLYVRLAVYDEHSANIGGDGNAGLPRRQARYVTVQFTDGSVDGRALRLGKSGRGDLQPGVIRRDDRIRVSGRLKGRVYVETMREWMSRAKCTDVTSALPNVDTLLDGVKARYGQVVIEATKLIQFG